MATRAPAWPFACKAGCAALITAGSTTTAVRSRTCRTSPAIRVLTAPPSASSRSRSRPVLASCSSRSGARRGRGDARAGAGQATRRFRAATPRRAATAALAGRLEAALRTSTRRSTSQSRGRCSSRVTRNDRDRRVRRRRAAPVVAHRSRRVFSWSVRAYRRWLPDPASRPTRGHGLLPISSGPTSNRRVSRSGRDLERVADAGGAVAAALGVTRCPMHRANAARPLPQPSSLAVPRR